MPRHCLSLLKKRSRAFGAPDGSLAGCCSVWLDPVSGWAELEPPGIVPSHRDLGLAREACHITVELGGHSVFINPAPLSYIAPLGRLPQGGLRLHERGYPDDAGERSPAL